MRQRGQQQPEQLGVRAVAVEEAVQLHPHRAALRALCAVLRAASHGHHDGRRAHRAHAGGLRLAQRGQLLEAHEALHLSPEQPAAFRVEDERRRGEVQPPRHAAAAAALRPAALTTASASAAASATASAAASAAAASDSLATQAVGRRGDERAGPAVPQLLGGGQPKGELQPLQLLRLPARVAARA